jgi:hypothetical protein
MEKRYSGLETTIEWLEKDKASCDQKCTDLQLMCVAYREKIQVGISFLLVCALV